MGPTKQVNEHFFDQESKVMLYILGISIAKYSARLMQSQPQNRWLSTSEPLIQIVKSSLDSEHAISHAKYKNIRTGEDYMAYWLGITSQKIYDSLSRRGLDVPKSERAFSTDIDDQHLDHFVRGFLDSIVSCHNYTVQSRSKNKLREFPHQSLKIYFNVPFLKGLYDALVSHTSINEGREVTESPLSFSTADTRAIYDFIYRDWDFIQENGLYLPSKKELFDRHTPDELFSHSPQDYSHHPFKVASQNRIERVKEKVLAGMSALEAGNEEGYSDTSVYRAFKNATGQTVREFLRENSQTLAS